MNNQLNHAPCGFFSLTTTGIVTSVNQTFLDLLNYQLDELIGEHIESLMSISNKFFFHTYFYPYIRLYGKVDEMVLTLHSRDGEDFPILLFGKKRVDNGIEIIDCICVHIPKRFEYEKEIRTISKKIEEAYKEKDEALAQLELLVEENEAKNEELIILNSQLERMATTDPLTGLRNRQFFQDSLTTQIHTFHENGVLFSICMVDIDFFKHVNDTWGHLVGDRVLVQLAQIMNSVCLDNHIIVRYGGEEFIVIFPETDALEALQTAEKLRTSVVNAAWHDCPITVSIGVTTFTNLDTANSILAKADRALYISKNNGRNRVTQL